MNEPNAHVPSVQAASMAKERIDTGGKVFGPYSPGVKANGVIWLAGQIAPEAGGIREQTQSSLDKIDALLAAAGATKQSGGEGSGLQLRTRLLRRTTS